MESYYTLMFTAFLVSSIPSKAHGLLMIPGMSQSEIRQFISTANPRKPRRPERIEHKLTDLEARCDFYIKHQNDQEQYLDYQVEDRQAIMFGLGESKDVNMSAGEFVAERLRKYRDFGFKYVAVDRVKKLNPHLGNPSLEEAYRKHYENFGIGIAPIVRKAEDLGLEIVFYDEDIDQIGDESARAEAQFANLKGLIFERDKDAKAVIISTDGHAHTYRFEKSFLDPRTVTPLGFLLNEYLKRSLITVLVDNGRPRSVSKFNFDNAFYVGTQCGDLSPGVYIKDDVSLD